LSRIVVEAEVLDDVEPATVDDIIEVIVDEAIDLSLAELARVWPVGPPRNGRPHSYTLFRREGNEITNPAVDPQGRLYAGFVRYKGTETPIIDTRITAEIGEDSVLEAVANLEALIGDKLDGAVYVILEQIIGNFRRS